MNRQLNILLADDDEDDRFFFRKILGELPFNTRLSTLDNGEKLMNFLLAHPTELPDLLFLDLNMPRKNGSECLSEIKQNSLLQDLKIVIYSTSLHEEVADTLYENGAHFYVKKTDIVDLQKVLSYILTLITEYRFERPVRSGFVIHAGELPANTPILENETKKN